MGIAQLTELRPTRRSPDRRAIEHEDRRTPVAILVEVDVAPERIRQDEVGNPLANFGPRCVILGKADAARIPKRRRGIESVRSIGMWTPGA